MIEWIKYYSTKGSPFGKGIIDDKGTHIAPGNFCVDCRNIRIINGTTTRRNGYVVVVDADKSTKSVNELISWADAIYGLIWADFCKIDLEERDYKIIKEGVGAESNLIRYANYIVVCNGTETGQAYNTKENKWEELTFPDSVKSSFGTVFRENIWIVGAWDKANVIYKSRAGKEDSMKDILDFKGTGSDRLTRPTEITGLASLQSKLYMFTKSTIEVITPQSMSNVGGVLAMHSNKIAWENELANHNTVIVADDRVFFWTKGNQLKCLEYLPGMTEISVGEITTRPNLSIQRFLDTLDPVQDKAFGYYHKEKALLYMFLKEKGEHFNNIALVYDVLNDTFTIDDNKFYWCATKHNGKYYAGSWVNTEIYEDETGNSDRGYPIRRYRKSTPEFVWDPNVRKEFRTVDIAWEKDSIANINLEILVDGQTAFVGQIAWEQGTPWGLATKMTGSHSIGGEASKQSWDRFERTISWGQLRKKGKCIQYLFSGDGYGDFCLSTLKLWYRPTRSQNKEERLQPFNQ